MPYITELTEDCLGIVHVGTGLVTGEDLIEGTRTASQLVQNTENFQFEFVDLSECSELQVTRQQLEEIVREDRVAATYRPRAIVAIVAPADAVFAIAQQWQHEVEDLDWRTLIARSRPEALKWLRDQLVLAQVRL
ncbi:MAG TPA: hypothetical protein VGI60_06245 [Chthoniobacterales bacterium]